jgi:hypothetical protein
MTFNGYNSNHCCVTPIDQFDIHGTDRNLVSLSINPDGIHLLDTLPDTCSIRELSIYAEQSEIDDFPNLCRQPIFRNLEALFVEAPYEGTLPFGGNMPALRILIIERAEFDLEEDFNTEGIVHLRLSEATNAEIKLLLRRNWPQLQTLSLPEWPKKLNLKPNQLSKAFPNLCTLIIRNETKVKVQTILNLFRECPHFSLAKHNRWYVVDQGVGIVLRSDIEPFLSSKIQENMRQWFV